MTKIFQNKFIKHKFVNVDLLNYGGNMILVNNSEMEWEKGLTVEKFLNANNFIIHLSIVKINGEFINKNSYFSQLINDNDDLKIIHLVAGG